MTRLALLLQQRIQIRKELVVKPAGVLAAENDGFVAIRHGSGFRHQESPRLLGRHGFQLVKCLRERLVNQRALVAEQALAFFQFFHALHAQPSRLRILRSLHHQAAVRGSHPLLCRVAQAGGLFVGIAHDVRCTRASVRQDFFLNRVCVHDVPLTARWR